MPVPIRSFKPVATLNAKPPLTSKKSQVSREFRITLEDFIGSVECSSLTSDDGAGYLATEDTTSNVVVPFSVVALRKILADGAYTHVVWYSK